MPLFTNVLEGKFCELRHNGVLRSSSKKYRNLAHLRDTPTPRTGVCCLRCVASRRRARLEAGRYHARTGREARVPGCHQARPQVQSRACVRRCRNGGAGPDRDHAPAHRGARGARLRAAGRSLGARGASARTGTRAPQRRRVEYPYPITSGRGPSFAGLRPFVVDRNICNFCVVWCG